MKNLAFVFILVLGTVAASAQSQPPRAIVIIDSKNLPVLNPKDLRGIRIQIGAVDTGQEGNGGHEMGIEFVNLLRKTLDEILLMDPVFAQELRGKGVYDILESGKLKVVVTDQPLRSRSGQTLQDSAMINDPESMTVTIQKQRFLVMNDPLIKQALILHEALSLKGLEGTGNYALTSRYLALFGKQLSVRARIEIKHEITYDNPGGWWYHPRTVGLFDKIFGTLTGREVWGDCKVRVMGDYYGATLTNPIPTLIFQNGSRYVGQYKTFFEKIGSVVQSGLSFGGMSLDPGAEAGTRLVRVDVMCQFSEGASRFNSAEELIPIMTEIIKEHLSVEFIPSEVL